MVLGEAGQSGVVVRCRAGVVPVPASASAATHNPQTVAATAQDQINKLITVIERHVQVTLITSLKQPKSKLTLCSNYLMTK